MTWWLAAAVAGAGLPHTGDAAVSAGGAARAGPAPPARVSVPAAPGSPGAEAVARGPVRIEMTHVNLRVAPDVTLSIRTLRGTLESTRPGAIPVFDDRESFLVRIQAAEIAVSAASLTALMNEHVLAYRGAPMKDVEVRLDEEGKLVQKGRLRKGISIPFKIEGTVEPTGDGRIRLRPEKVKAARIPVRSLMRRLGIEMDDVVKIEPGRGITVQDNDVILDPQELLPPPRIRGKVTAVRVEANQIVQTLGESGADAARPLSPAANAPNHMYFLGGRLRFGKLTMEAADLELIDEDPADPFEFDLAHYNEMLVAGYSKNTPRYGLRTYMPDYDDLVRKATARAASSAP